MYMCSRTRGYRRIMLFIMAAVCLGFGFVTAIVTDLLAESSRNASQGSETNAPAVSTVLSRQSLVASDQSPVATGQSPVASSQSLAASVLLLQRQASLPSDLGHDGDTSQAGDGWIELRVTATAYNSDKRSTGKEPGHPAYRVTYTGTTALEGRTIAVDPEVIPLGSEIRISALSPYTYIAEDTGRLIKGNRIDIYMENEQDCLNWGVRRVRIMYRHPKQVWGCNRNYL